MSNVQNKFKNLSQQKKLQELKEQAEFGHDDEDVDKMANELQDLKGKLKDTK